MTVGDFNENDSYANSQLIEIKLLMIQSINYYLSLDQDHCLLSDKLIFGVLPCYIRKKESLLKQIIIFQLITLIFFCLFLNYYISIFLYIHELAQVVTTKCHRLGILNYKNLLFNSSEGQMCQIRVPAWSGSCKRCLDLQMVSFWLGVYVAFPWCMHACRREISFLLLFIRLSVLS